MNNIGRPELQSRVAQVVGNVYVDLFRDVFSPLSSRYYPAEPIEVTILGGLIIRDERRSTYDQFHKYYEDEGTFEALRKLVNGPAFLVLLRESTVNRDFDGVPIDVTPEKSVIALYESNRDGTSRLLAAIPGEIDPRSNPLQKIYDNSEVGDRRWTVALTDKDNVLIGRPIEYESSLISYMGHFAAEDVFLVPGVSHQRALDDLERAISNPSFRYQLRASQSPTT